jgi:hypothetical protein
VYDLSQFRLRHEDLYTVFCCQKADTLHDSVVMGITASVCYTVFNNSVRSLSLDDLGPVPRTGSAPLGGDGAFCIEKGAALTQLSMLIGSYLPPIHRSVISYQQRTSAAPQPRKLRAAPVTTNGPRILSSDRSERAGAVSVSRLSHWLNNQRCLPADRVAPIGG